MRITLALPPLSQLNTPYPSIGYLARSLRRGGHEPVLRDLGNELVTRLFSMEGLRRVFDAVSARAESGDELPEPAWRALALRQQHEAAIGPVIRFLQGRDRTLAPRILDSPLLPRTPRLSRADLSLFGTAASSDAARRLATLYLEDLADLVTATLDDGFALARYQHHLGVGPNTFEPLALRLGRTTVVDALIDELADSIDTGIVGLSVPFPGTLYAALRIGGRLRRRGVTVLMGGGYVNTELRDVEESQLWDYVDALSYDAGEGPLIAWLEWASGGPDRRHRTRTAAGLLGPAPGLQPPDVPQEFAASYQGLPLDRYLQLVDGPNPTHRLWSDGRWNKITLAHGCYWKKCRFCDIQLDYIARYVPGRAAELADIMEELLAETGTQGFHFVDEAAPPKLMKELALEILRRGLIVSWWGNIRFDRTFTPDLCRLLAHSGLVAVTGGLEVASDRLLKQMEKGVTVEQVARCAKAFRDAGVLVHAYLMYGYPTQTDQETLDAMELVRQLFETGTLGSAFWHRFVLTRHSGFFPDPERLGVRPRAAPPGVFARNDVAHDDPTGGNHDRFDDPLPAALGAWMAGEGLQKPVQSWIAGLKLAPTERPDRIARAVGAREPESIDGAARLIWLGGEVLEEDDQLVIHGLEGAVRLGGPAPLRQWLGEVLTAARPQEAPLRHSEVFPGGAAEARRMSMWNRARKAGLILV